jgi:hypothetical protein
LRRLFAPIVVLLVYLLAPGAAEMTEYAVHWVEHGDGAHADDAGHEQRDGTDEHGCSGTFHMCLCHHGAGAVTSPAAVAVVAAAFRDRVIPFWRHRTPSSVAAGDIFRPPIA